MKSTVSINDGIPDRQQGGSCIFLRINKKWGLKLYKTIQTANFNFVLQKEFLKFGFATELGHLVDIGRPEFYGYTTRLAEIKSIEETLADPQFEFIKHFIEARGYCSLDMDRAGNMGYVGGCMVILDFSEFRVKYVS